MFPASTLPSQEDDSSLKSPIASLGEKVDRVQVQLAEFDNPEQLFAPGATESLRKLSDQLSSLEQTYQEIDKAVAKLKGAEKEALSTYAATPEKTAPM
jgi:DNA repair ATPase RecN